MTRWPELQVAELQLAPGPSAPEGPGEGSEGHLKGRHGEEGPSLRCGLKGSNQNQPVQATPGRFQGGRERVP